MLDTLGGRLLVVALLLGTHLAMFPLYAQQPVDPEAGVYPDEDAFVTDPDRYLGESVTTGGTVRQLDPLVIAVDTPRGVRELTVTGTDLSPSIGDRVRVFGTLATPLTIESTGAFVVPPSGLWYAWGISFIAGLWVLARLVSHWTVDRTRLAFVPREEPLTLADLQSLVGGGSDA